MLVHGDAEIRDMIVPEFYGHVRRMIKHPEASWILDDVYRGIATPQQKAIMLREWYGAEFAIFKTNVKAQTTSDLADMLAQNPEKRTPIMRSLHDLINQLVQKKTTGFTMLHDAMLQYFLASKTGSEEATDFIELLKGDEEGDLLKNLAFTKSGARLVCLALAYGIAKDRKHILKTYKDTIQTLAYDTHGHQVLLAAYDIIDDTVLTSKAIFPELLGKDTAAYAQQGNILSYAIHLTGRIPLLYLFAGKAKWLLPDEDRDLLDELHGIRKTTSKKEPEIRRKELLRALSVPLLASIAAQAETLVQTSFGCQFISEVLLDAEGDKREALDAIASIAKSNMEAFESPAAGRMMKSLVLGGRYNSKTKTVDLVDPPLHFHDLLHAQIEPDIVAWATGANSFVVVGLLEAEGFSHKDALLKILRKNTKILGQAATQKPKEQEALKEGGDGKNTKSEGSKGKRQGGEIGNKGTKLLLQKLG
ncbi:MAG: pumilio domain member 6 [Pleopsidium flavum]|nr:MAG: pumilio domain member 6 [Pleopsidium flavum]